MREIFKHQHGKDFYRNSLEYFEYNEEEYEKDTPIIYERDDDEISYHVLKKMQKNKI